VINVSPFSARDQAVDTKGILTRTFNRFVNDLFGRLSDTLTVYRQDIEPQLKKPDQSAIWIDTATGNLTYLIFCRANGDQVKTQLT
jgi:hypothetical protein